jgi:hypothetical protein
MSTLKWKKREEGYITKTPAGISIITPASHITNQDLSLLLNWPEIMSERMPMCSLETVYHI